MLFVRLSRTFTVDGTESDDEFDAHTDLVMESLLALESDAVSDSDVSATISERLVTVSLVASGDNFDAAAQTADSCIRAAIHAAGGSTPEWVTIGVESKQLQAA